MATPVGITLPNNGLILELVDDLKVNTATIGKLGGGFVRQIGMSVDWDIDDFVQYDGNFGFQFSQDGVTYLFIENENILFKQDPGVAVAITGSVGNTQLSACQNETTFYSDAPLGVGIILYTDSTLTTPVTGYIYYSDMTNLYDLDSATGEILSATGLFCTA